MKTVHGRMGRQTHWLTALLLCTALTRAQNPPSPDQFCGTHPVHPGVRPADNMGGIYLPSRGTLRVLLVFASFPDDETPHPYWPAHHPPLFMSQFIDPDSSTHSDSPFNLTAYFRQMSLGQFQFIGEALWVESLHSQEEYLNGSFGRANTNVLQESVDSLVDFSLYDNWTRLENYHQVNAPDSTVDMIIMVWRTTMWRFLGEASLGYKPAFFADGKRIEMGFPEYLPCPRGSGVTCEYPYADSPYQVMQSMVHEVSHWLLGGLHPYNGTTLSGKHAYWGMMCNGGRVGSCVNTYERERLGWFTAPEILPGQDISLGDYLTTGAAAKFHPANGDPLEYYYFENHRMVSTFDDVTSNPGDKGLWILHQDGPYVELDNLKICPSDGVWNWENPASTSLCYQQELPVFKRGAPGIRNGRSHRDQIPTATSDVNWMMVYEDPSGNVQCGDFPRGDHFFGAFTLEQTPVFSFSSNPPTNTWGGQPVPLSVEIVSEGSGSLTLRFPSNPLDAAPARRYLGSDPTTNDTVPGHVSLAWGSQWPDGQPVESDVCWSELQRRHNAGEEWTTIYAGPETRWAGPFSVLAVADSFRVRVRDTQNTLSAWSNVYSTSAPIANGVGSSAATPVGYGLDPSYPNPFNPATRIIFRIADPVHVNLRIFDLLGREVRILVDENMKPGSYERTFEAGDLSSGIYFCRLCAGGFSETQKILLVR